MEESHFEKELKNIFDLFEQMKLNNKSLAGLTETELINEIQKLKFQYFRIGYLCSMMKK